jgi:hypothetical protein
MKFLVNSPQTQKALKRLAGTSHLLINFFFWNLGTGLQKRHTGMLRSLLHMVIKEHPNLIASVFPRVWENRKESDAKNKPNLVELKTAFERLREESFKFLKLCIFINGVNKADGDYQDILKFLWSLSSPSIKVGYLKSPH